MITQLEQNKVKELLDKGILTAEQADEITEALEERDDKEVNAGMINGQDDPDIAKQDRTQGSSTSSTGGEQGKPPYGSFVENLTRGATDMASSAMNMVFSEINSALGHIQGSSQGGNKIVMSKVDQPDGNRYIFSDNEIMMGKLTDVTLNEASMKGNKITGSSVGDLKVAVGAFSGNKISAASVFDLSIENGIINECAFAGSKVHDLRIQGRSTITAATIEGSNVSDVRLADESRIEKCSIKSSNCRSLALAESSQVGNLEICGSNVRDINLKSSNITGFSVQASNVSDMSFTKTAVSDVRLGASKVYSVHCVDSVLKELVISGMAVLRLHIENCELTGVTFKKKAAGFKFHHAAKMRLINSKIKNCEFINCTFFNIDFKDVDISDIHLSDAIIKNQTITCKEDLLRYQK
jgi:uncharacterized protein YjbI with pentapeptide repeats